MSEYNKLNSNSEFLRINSDGSFKLADGQDPLRVIGALAQEFIKQNDKIKRLEQEVQKLKVVNEYAWQKNGKLNERIRHLIKLGLETAEYGLQNHREQWEQEEEL